jgi:carotenoid cleavage dioxygenase
VRRESRGLSDSCTEFGTINSGSADDRTCTITAATNEPGWFLFNGLVKHDTLTGREERYQFEPGVFCREVGALSSPSGSPVAHIAAGRLASLSEAGERPGLT